MLKRSKNYLLGLWSNDTHIDRFKVITLVISAVTFVYFVVKAVKKRYNY